MRGEHARNIARDAGYVVVPVDDYGAVRAREGVLEVGPDASPDAIATLACRRQLQEIGVWEEARTRTLVAELGFDYVPQLELRSTSASGVAYRAVC